MAATVSWSNTAAEVEPYSGPPRNIQAIDAVQFDSSLTPKEYKIAGTKPGSKILITDVNILDSTGREPYRGDVLIEGMWATSYTDCNSCDSWSDPLPSLQGKDSRPSAMFRIKKAFSKTPMSDLSKARVAL
jgi:hypothetical protein